MKRSLGYIHAVHKTIHYPPVATPQYLSIVLVAQHRQNRLGHQSSLYSPPQCQTVQMYIHLEFNAAEFTITSDVVLIHVLFVCELHVEVRVMIHCT